VLLLGPWDRERLKGKQLRYLFTPESLACAVCFTYLLASVDNITLSAALYPFIERENIGKCGPETGDENERKDGSEMGHASTAGMPDLIHPRLPTFPYTSTHVLADLRYPLHLSYDILGQA
jgi:hypothetical protein